MIKVTVELLYHEKKGKSDKYYQEKAFDDIYNSDDWLNSENFKVEKVKSILDLMKG